MILAYSALETLFTTVFRKPILEASSDVSPNQVGFDETVIRIDSQKHWLYATADAQSAHILHRRLFSTIPKEWVEIFLSELQRKQDVDDTHVRIEDADHLKAPFRRAGLRFRVYHHGNLSAIEDLFER